MFEDVNSSMFDQQLFKIVKVKPEHQILNTTVRKILNVCGYNDPEEINTLVRLLYKNMVKEDIILTYMYKVSNLRSAAPDKHTIIYCNEEENITHIYNEIYSDSEEDNLDDYIYSNTILDNYDIVEKISPTDKIYILIKYDEFKNHKIKEISKKTSIVVYPDCYQFEDLRKLIYELSGVVEKKESQQKEQKDETDNRNQSDNAEDICSGEEQKDETQNKIVTNQ